VAPVVGQLANFGFGHMPKRESAASHALLAQSPQHVTLVFMAIGRLLNVPATSIGLVELGVVAGGNELAVHSVGALQQGAPLDVGVAKYARVGRAAGHVFVDKVVDDVVAKFVADIDDEVGETHVDGHFAGVVDGVEATAAGLLLRPAAIRVIPGFHGNSDNFISLLMQDHGRNGGVDAAAHGDEYTSVLAHICCFFAQVQGPGQNWSYVSLGLSDHVATRRAKVKLFGR